MGAGEGLAPAAIDTQLTIRSPHRLRGRMATNPLTLLQGTLDLLVLRCLSGGSRHGYAIATMVGEQTGGDLSVEDAALYQALHRLHRQDLVDAEWGPSENNRRARFYTLTPAGRKRLREETTNWRRYVRAVDAVLQEA